MWYNIRHIVSFTTNETCENSYLENNIEVKKTGNYWWNLLCLIPIYRYTVKQDLYSLPFEFCNVPLDTVLKYYTNTFFKDNTFYIYPHIFIRFSDGYSTTKYFKTDEEMYAFADNLKSQLEKKEEHFIEL